MSNLEELKNLFKEALNNNSDVLIDPFDLAILFKLLDSKTAIKLYNALAALSEDEIEEMKKDIDVKPYDILVIYNKELYSRIIDAIKRNLVK
jgi:hypothetical protein